MFSIAYVVLSFTDTPPADAITASLACFQRGRRGDLPDDWLAAHDETEGLRSAHQTQFTFTDYGKYGLGIEGGSDAAHQTTPATATARSNPPTMSDTALPNYVAWASFHD